MKKCPACYAIMRRMKAPIEDDPSREVSEARTRYECPQCGHIEESLADPTQITKH